MQRALNPPIGGPAALSGLPLLLACVAGLRLARVISAPLFALVLLVVPVATASGPTRDEPWAIPPQSSIGALGSDGHASYLFGGMGTTEVGGKRSDSIFRIDQTGIVPEPARLPTAIGRGAALWIGNAFVVLSSDAEGVPAAQPFVYDPAKHASHVITLPAGSFVHGAHESVWDGQRIDILATTSDGHIDHLDPETGTFTAGAPLPLAGHGGAAAFDPRATATCPRGCAYLFSDAEPIVRYEPASDQATLLDARWPGGGVVNAVWDGREVLVVSAKQIPNAREELYSIRAFDPTAGTVRDVLTLPPLQGGVSAAWRDGGLDIIVMRACPSCANSLLRLDPSTGIATLVSGQMLDAYSGDVGTVVDGQLYLLGAGTGGISTSIVRFDLASGVEQVLPARLPDGTSTLSTAALGSIVYDLVSNASAFDLVRFDTRSFDVTTVGSFASPERPARLVATATDLLAFGHSGVSLVDTRTGALTSVAGADQALSDFVTRSLAWDGSRIDIVGGGTDVVTFDPATHAFAKGPTLPRPVFEPSLAFDGTRVLVVGGCQRGCNSRAYSTTIMTIDGATQKTGELAEPAPNGLLRPAVGANPHHLLVVGGTWVDRPWDAVERYQPGPSSAGGDFHGVPAPTVWFALVAILAAALEIRRDPR